MINTTIKILLRNKPNTKNLYPVIMRITKNRKSKIISMGMECLSSEWDETVSLFKRNHKNYTQRNRILLQKQAEALKIIDEFELENIDFTLTQFEERFKGTKDLNITMKSFWQEKISDLNKSGRTGNARAYKDTMNSFFKFINNEKLVFREVTVEMLDKYETFLRSNGGTDGGIAVKMREIRALFNDAIKKGVVAEKHYPFRAYKISKLKGKGQKRALTRDEVELIEKLDTNAYPHLKLSKQLFIFSYYTRGMNFYDMMKLKWLNIENGYIVYTRSKTKSNFKIKILPPVQEIINEMKGYKTTSYIFPLILNDNFTPEQLENRKLKALKKFNKDLKLIANIVGINKKVTSYVARHSFATNLREAGESTDVISQSMGHQNVGITVAYLKDFDDNIIDNAHEKLLREAIPIYKTDINQGLTSA